MKVVKFSFLIIVICVSTIGNAQFKFGVGGGYNFSNFHGEDIDKMRGIVAFLGGAKFDYKFSNKIGIEGDFLISLKGATHAPYKEPDITSLLYIDLPIVIKFYFLEVANLQVGFQESLLSSAKSKSINDERFKSRDFSYVIGLGFNFNRINLTIRHTRSLFPILKNGVEIRNNVINISIATWIKK